MSEVKKEKRITKAERCQQIIDILKDMKDTEDLIVFLEHEKENFSKRSNKPTARQKENIELAEVLYDVMDTIDEPQTITSIMRLSGAFDGMNNQKVTALMNMLKQKNLVQKVGNKSLYIRTDKIKAEEANN